MHKIAVYGSLKKGFYNHDRFTMGEMLGVAKVRGAMFLNYSYPHLFREEDSAPEMVKEYEVEIYEIEDREYKGIVGMEVGAGYQEFKTTITDTSGAEHDVTIFFARDGASHYKNNWIGAYDRTTAPHAYRDEVVA